MKPFGPTLLICEVDNLALGYRLMDGALKAANIKALEASPMSPGKFFLLLNGAEEEIEKAKVYLEKEIPKCDAFLRVVDGIHPDLLEGLYGLLKTKVNEALLVIETKSMGRAIEVANCGLKDFSLSLIEIRSSRGIGGKSLVFLTGTSDQAEAHKIEIENNSRTGSISAQVIENPHKDFLELFQI